LAGLGSSIDLAILRTTTTVTDEPGLLTNRQVAERLGICQATVQRAAREGGIPFVRLRTRGNLYFRPGDIEHLISAGDRDPHGKETP
jgi:excisionase family DNA binding protein